MFLGGDARSFSWLADAYQGATEVLQEEVTSSRKRRCSGQSYDGGSIAGSGRGGEDQLGGDEAGAGGGEPQVGVGADGDAEGQGDGGEQEGGAERATDTASDTSALQH